MQGGDGDRAGSAACSLQGAAEGPGRSRRLREALPNPGRPSRIRPAQLTAPNTEEAVPSAGWSPASVGRRGGGGEGTRARAEGGTFGPGTAGWPEGTVGTALRAREAEKSGRAETAQWARAPRILDGASPAGPG